ncbi:MAG: hypothetical protein DWQ47_00780 [Acidobacteria bacterium]|nr:MAG: hypothetical protein DWQ32_11240 [Acidobacteriota bacterium]REK04040.1 MAG: hypothetical protein DWQ38_00765 [Acidobacteriota bacterium]REK15202.1 MAG: hypothetical protein DWQ43_16930 [Acidobacteriota bacterium]REK46292.1 MAG: hypothetical protein DWQ47_00780 [Acidobacteriota bacterium]
MKKSLEKVLSVSLASLFLLAGTGFAQLDLNVPPDICLEDDERVAVLLVGSYHMSNPGLDRFNLKADDVLAEKRQKEISDLVERLADFKATKVAVEAPWGHEPTLERWQKYIAGEIELRKSESEQVGFRLAKKMGHQKIYPVDVRMMLDDKELGPVIAANPEFQKKMGEMDKFGGQAMEQMGKWLSEGTISYMLYQMNRPEMLKLAHTPYVGYFLPMVKDENYAGADYVTVWYQRNLRIFANLTRISEKGDRIFVIYGQGHIPIIKQLVESSPDYCTVDPLPFLKEK